MSPLTLHASAPAQNVGRRRVIHVEYAVDDLPGGLDWNNRVGAASSGWLSTAAPLRCAGFRSRSGKAGGYGFAMRALWHGRVLADSAHTIEVDGYVYFPRDSVRMDWLRLATKTNGDRMCSHGVQFYDVVVEGETAERNAWSYENPKAAMRRVDQWLSFWDEVEIVA